MLPFYKLPGTKAGDSYQTPEWLYRALDAEFRFTLDPCPLNPAFDPAIHQDGLLLDWTGQRIWCNPPYSNILPWVGKAITSRALTVFLLPVRTEMEWFFLLREAGAELRFLRKRISFITVEGKKARPAENSVIAIVRRLV